MAKGVSLLELVIGMVVTGGVTLAVINFSSSAMQGQKNSNLRSQTEQKMRIFLETQKKRIALSLPSNPNNNCSILDAAPTVPICGAEINFRTLKLNRFRDPLTSTGPFDETTTTVCLPAPIGLVIDPAIRDCTPCLVGEVPVVRTTTDNGVVLRFSGAQEIGANNIADDGVTLASALCITHNPLSIPANPNSFTLLNLRLRTLVLQNKETRLLEMSASVPTPRLQPGNIRVLSSGK